MHHLFSVIKQRNSNYSSSTLQALYPTKIMILSLWANTFIYL